MHKLIALFFIFVASLGNVNAQEVFRLPRSISKNTEKEMLTKLTKEKMEDGNGISDIKDFLKKNKENNDTVFYLQRVFSLLGLSPNTQAPKLDVNFGTEKTLQKFIVHLP